MDMEKVRLPIGKTRFSTSKSKYETAIANYGVDFDPGDQPDLLYARSIFCSEGINKRRDGFLRDVLFDIYKSAINKFVDYEHDENGENKKGVNPEKYHIIGHIYASYLADQDTGEVIPDEICVRGEDGKIFPIGSKYRDSKLDVIVDWVLYKFEFPDVADQVYDTRSDASTGFGVSMEILFRDYKFRVGDMDPAESFEDTPKDGSVIEAKAKTSLGNILADMFKAKMVYNGKPIVRIIGNASIFSGMAVTASRANPRSWNLATASDTVDGYITTNHDKSRLIEIIKSVASRNSGEKMECKIIEGEPDCDCVENAVASELQLLTANITRLSTILAQDLEDELELEDMGDEEEQDIVDEIIQQGDGSLKRKDVNPKEGKKKYGNVKFADPVNKKYPIDTPEHIRAAWNYIHHKKNAGKYDATDKKAIVGRIKRAWKSKIDKNGPPSAE